MLGSRLTKEKGTSMFLLRNEGFTMIVGLGKEDNSLLSYTCRVILLLKGDNDITTELNHIFPIKQKL